MHARGASEELRDADNSLTDGLRGLPGQPREPSAGLTQVCRGGAQGVP
eukprot:CAMPEP_0179024488 /NCGR_PEP_ID=MMETSP0796-20121207/7478_1 /TAXON_ID=73915 /ORGANISM="Pyrodinium bahamense, Strain pbaha01" /LENGTH=47 /DNA_ID= /DNA_START= /DNA_END= /DNA_ORIENTATION=